jgi:hypothetical protein
VGATGWIRADPIWCSVHFCCLGRIHTMIEELGWRMQRMISARNMIKHLSVQKMVGENHVCNSVMMVAMGKWCDR